MRTNVYPDQFSKTDNTSLLIALRSYVDSKVNPNVKILLEVELTYKGLIGLLKTVYYFPSTNVLFIEPRANTSKYDPANWFASSSTKPVDFDVSPFV